MVSLRQAGSVASGPRAEAARTVNPANNEPEDPKDFPKPPMIDKTASLLQWAMVTVSFVCKLSLFRYESVRK